MFDPHRTRRSDYRYYTRKGQVLQASRVNINPVIDQRLVPIYKNYLLKNNLVQSPIQAIKPIGIAIAFHSLEINYYPFTEFNVSTKETFGIELSSGSTLSALLIFQQKTDGSLQFIGMTFSGNIGYSIENNTKCYYKAIPINSEGDFQGSMKALYHSSPSPENIFLSYDIDVGSRTQNLSIFPPVPIVL